MHTIYQLSLNNMSTFILLTKDLSFAYVCMHTYINTNTKDVLMGMSMHHHYVYAYMYTVI